MPNCNLVIFWICSFEKPSIIAFSTISDLIPQIKNAGCSPVNEIETEVVLNKPGLIAQGILSYAAWHLFSNQQTVELQLAVFKGDDKSSFSDIKVYKGNLYYLLETAGNYAKDKINWHVAFGTDMKRHEYAEIPVNAFVRP
jgi:hypothetical protein